MLMSAGKTKSFGLIRSHSNIISPNSHRNNTSITIIETTLLPPVLPLQGQGFPFDLAGARISPINEIDRISDISDDQGTDEQLNMNDQNFSNRNKGVMIKHISKNGQYQTQNQGDVFQQQGSTRHPQQAKDPRANGKHPAQNTGFPSQGKSANSQMHQGNQKENGNPSSRLTHSESMTGPEAVAQSHQSVHTRDYGMKQFRSAGPSQAFASHPNSQGNINAGLHDRGRNPQPIARNMHDQQRLIGDVNMGPPANCGGSSAITNRQHQPNQGAPLESRIHTYHQAEPSPIKPPLDAIERFRDQSRKHKQRQEEEEFDEIASDIDQFEEDKPAEGRSPSLNSALLNRPLSDHHRQAGGRSIQATKMNDYSAAVDRAEASRLEGAHESFHIPGYPGAPPPSHQPSTGVNQKGIRPSGGSGGPARQSQSAQHRLPQTTFAQALEDPFTNVGAPAGLRLDADGVPIFDELDVNSSSGNPITPKKYTSGQDTSRDSGSAFNFTPSAKESDTVNEVQPQPEPRFQIPYQLNDHCILIKSFIQREQIFQEAMKCTQVADFQPSWDDVKSEADGVTSRLMRGKWLTDFLEVHTGLSVELNECNHHFQALEKSLGNLISIKDAELKRKIGLTERYGDAGSDLSNQCQTMQLSTRNNVKKRKVEVEVD